MIRDLDCYAATTKISCFFFLFSQIAENASPFSSSAEDDKTQLREKNSIQFLYKICIILLNSLNKTYLDENKKKHGKPSTLVVIARLTDNIVI